MNTLSVPTLDMIIIVFYMILILGVGIASRGKGKMSGSRYFLAGRQLNWKLVGAALFASNISTIHLVGLAASGYNEGLVWGNFEWMASFTLIILGLVFAPFYFRSKISTLPEFLEKRYDSRSRTLLAFMAIIAALFVHIGISLYAGAIVFKAFFGINVIYSILLISVITTIYTVVGGLKAVVITESIQTVILISGSIILTVIAFNSLGDHGIHTMEEFKNVLKPDQLSMIRGNQSGGDAGLTWYAVLLGYPILGLWYWCSDQTIVQRVLGAKTQQDAQVGAIFAGFLKILPVFIMVFPGVIAYAIFRDQIGTDSNQALPVLIIELMPTGLKGIMAAALLSALMSTIASALNSSATLVTYDIVQRLKPEITDETQVRIGRISAVVVMILAIFWSTQGGRFSSIFDAINRIAAALAPPIATVFLFGVFSKRGTSHAAFITLISGFLLGASAFSLDFIPPIYNHPAVITETLGIPFMMQAWWLFCICSGIYWVVSYVTIPSDPLKLENLTWANPMSVITEAKFLGIKDARFLALILLISMIVLYVIFR